MTGALDFPKQQYVLKTLLINHWWCGRGKGADNQGIRTLVLTSSLFCLILYVMKRQVCSHPSKGARDRGHLKQ